MISVGESKVAFFFLLLVRLQAALWSIISDCDETYNYWEPLHYVLKGRGFQTWEYSPAYGLRSYSYLWMHALPAKILNLSIANGEVVFYFLRCLLAVSCAILEYRLFTVIKRKCETTVARMFLLFQLLCPGMFISSTALLPSSFAMYVTMATMTAWMNEGTKTAVAITALSGLIGWPFAVIVSIPFVMEVILKRKQIFELVKSAIIFGILFGAPIVLIDSAYFGRLTVAALNIVLYNVFTSHGPDLYGVEPASFYIKNLLLNHNLAVLMCLLYPIAVILAIAFGIKTEKRWLSPLSALWKLSPLYLWLAVFFAQPHKEERFIFPVYPLFSFGAALLLSLLGRFVERIFGAKKSSSIKRALATAIIGISFLLGLSRIIAIRLNYGAPMTILRELQNDAPGSVNLCYGKEWYRFPGSFFVPSNYRVRFIPSSFTGMLPAYFQETENGTTLVHDYFNDQNLGHPHMLFKIESCDFLVDLDTGEAFDSSNPEPNYSADFATWSIVKSSDFVIAAKSNSFARAFYVPFISARHLVVGKYNLLERIKKNY